MTGVCIFTVILGVWFLISALANWEWYKGITDIAAIETTLGEESARWVFGMSGLFFIGLGIYWLVIGD